MAFDYGDGLIAADGGIAVSPNTAPAWWWRATRRRRRPVHLHSFTVTARDAYGNVATSFTGTVALSSTGTEAGPPPAVLPSPAAAAGQWRAHLQRGAGNGRHAVDHGRRLGRQPHGRRDRHPGGGRHGGQPGRVAATPRRPRPGRSHDFDVTAEDAYGNVAPGYTRHGDACRASDSQAGFSVTAPYAFTAATAASHALQRRPGDGGHGDDHGRRRGGRPDRQRRPASRSRPRLPSLTLSRLPDGDHRRHGAVLHDHGPRTRSATSSRGYTGTVTLDKHRQRFGLIATTYTFTTGSADRRGVHTFTGALDTAGTQSITARRRRRRPGRPARTGIVVRGEHGGEPGRGTGARRRRRRAVESFTVTAEDAYGNVVTGFTGTVTLSSSDSSGGLLHVEPVHVHRREPGQRRTHLQRHAGTAGTQSITATGRGRRLTGSEAGIVVTGRARP